MPKPPKMPPLLKIMAMALICTGLAPHPLQATQDSTYHDKNNAYWMIGAHALFYTTTISGLYFLWYKDYPTERFHWFNDNDEWQQMDKAGHFYSAYQIDKLCHRSFRWAGMDDHTALLYGNMAAFLYIGSIEVFDGFSTQWGASPSDLAANSTGLLLYTAQQWAWGEERIIPKFSYHSSPYADYRPGLLGSGWHESLVKDYNGQTYWLSLNLHALTGLDYLPPWLCLSAGYSAEGMVGGPGNNVDGRAYYFPRYRKYLISLDVDLARIPVSNKTLKTLLEALNIIKVPLPTIEFNSLNDTRYHWLYF